MDRIDTITPRLTPFWNISDYWVFQISGWLGFAALSYFSLTIWYNPGELVPALHTVLQAVLGVFVSHPLRWVAKASWDRRMVTRVIINGGGVLAASIIWTALRLSAFTWMSGEVIDMGDWGGWIFGSITVMASWDFCYHALKYYRQWNEQRTVAAEAQRAALEAKAIAQQESIKRLHAENLAREAQLRSLKYQLNPHFFFNALNSVTSLVQKENKQGAIEMLARIGEFLRTSLDDDDALEHTLRDEVEILNLYLGIEKVRFGDRLNVVFDLSDEAQAAEIPSLLLQPLVENGIKHAVSKRLETTNIWLSARCENSRLIICVADDGPGFHQDGNEVETTSHGIGLRNVEERLQSLYEDDFELLIAPREPQGVSFTITLPLQTP